MSPHNCCSFISIVKDFVTEEKDECWDVFLKSN